MADKTVRQMADELLERGFREFIGNGLIIEIATQNLPADETCTLPPIESPTLPPLPPLAGSVGNWEFCGQIKPLDSGDFRFYTETSPALPPAPPLVAPDFGVVMLAGTKPGSEERIEAMRNLYAPAVDELAAISLLAKSTKISADDFEPSAQVSAFPMAMNDLADKLAVLGLDYADDGKTVSAVKKNRRD